MVEVHWFLLDLVGLWFVGARFELAGSLMELLVWLDEEERNGIWGLVVVRRNGKRETLSPEFCGLLGGCFWAWMGLSFVGGEKQWFVSSVLFGGLFLLASSEFDLRFAHLELVDCWKWHYSGGVVEDQWRAMRFWVGDSFLFFRRMRKSEKN